MRKLATVIPVLVSIAWAKRRLMIWARRIIDSAEWNEVQDQFESLFMKLGCPGQMMLAASCGSDPTMLFASLPNPVLLNALVGVEQIGDSEFPSEASLFVGYKHTFHKRFRHPKWQPAGLDGHLRWVGTRSAFGEAVSLPSNPAIYRAERHNKLELLLT